MDYEHSLLNYLTRPNSAGGEEESSKASDVGCEEE